MMLFGSELLKMFFSMMEDADESMEKYVSELIVSECQILPKSYDALSDRLTNQTSYGICCGSVMEFYIRSFSVCIDDMDLLIFGAGELAVTEKFPQLPLDISGLSDMIKC